MAEQEDTWLGMRPAAWIKIALIFVLMAALFRFNLWRLWLKTNPVTGEANWGHSMVVPIIGLYYLYIHREELAPKKNQKDKSDLFKSLSVFGMLGFLVLAAAQYVRLYTGMVTTPIMQAIAGGAGALILLSPIMIKATAIRGLIASLFHSSSGWFGAGTMLIGLVTYAYAIYPGQNDFLKDFGMVVTLFGVVLLICGWHVMKTAWFPIFFLICAIPWPGLVYSWVAGPLQTLAAKVAVTVLGITGVDAAQYGTKISIARPDGQPPRTLNVAEACAGMRSLMTFISVGGAVAFLSSRPLWQKFIVMASAVPIAILCNVTRVSGQGLLDYYVSEQLSESFAHAFVGLIMLIPAFFLILLVGWVLDKIFIDEIESKKAELTRAQPSRVVVQPTVLPAAIPAEPAPRPAVRPVVRPNVARPVQAAGITLPPLSARAQAAQRRVKPPAKPSTDPSANGGAL